MTLGGTQRVRSGQKLAELKFYAQAEDTNGANIETEAADWWQKVYQYLNEELTKKTNKDQGMSKCIKGYYHIFHLLMLISYYSYVY